jgi:hypothetical protein
MRRAPKARRKAPEAPGLRVRVDANYARSLTLAMHEAMLARALPEILERIVVVASMGYAVETVTLQPRGFDELNTKALLLTLAGKLVGLGFRVEPVMGERQGTGYIQTYPALEVSWL